VLILGDWLYRHWKRYLYLRPAFTFFSDFRFRASGYSDRTSSRCTTPPVYCTKKYDCAEEVMAADRRLQPPHNGSTCASEVPWQSGKEQSQDSQETLLWRKFVSERYSVWLSLPMATLTRARKRLSDLRSESNLLVETAIFHYGLNYIYLNFFDQIFANYWLSRC